MNKETFEKLLMSEEDASKYLCHNLIATGEDPRTAHEKVDLIVSDELKFGRDCYSDNCYDSFYVLSARLNPDVEDIHGLDDVIDFDRALNGEMDGQQDYGINQILQNLDNYAFIEVEDIVDSKGNTMKIFCPNPEEKPYTWIRTGHHFALKGITSDFYLGDGLFGRFKSNVEFGRYLIDYYDNNDYRKPNMWMNLVQLNSSSVATSMAEGPFIVLFENQDVLVDALTKEKNKSDSQNKSK